MPYITVDDRSDTLAKLVRTITVEGLTRAQLSDEVRRLNPGVDIDALAHGTVIAVPATAEPARRADAVPVHLGAVAISDIRFDDVVPRAESEAVRARTELEHTAGPLKEAVHSGVMPFPPDAFLPLLEALAQEAEATADGGTVIAAFESLRGKGEG